MKIDPGFLDEVVARALKDGADQAEVFMNTSKSLSVEIKGQAVESLKSSTGLGYSLRIIKDGRLGFSYATDVKDSDSVIANAIEATRFSDPDEFLGLPEAGAPADVSVMDPLLRAVDEEEAIKAVMLMEKSVYETDSRIKKVRKASGSFGFYETAIANSRGVRAAYESSACSAQVTAIAEVNGESQVGWDYDAGCFLRNISFEGVGRGAAQRAAWLLGSRKITGCKGDVIMDNSVTAEFLGIFASSLSSEAVQKGKSLLADRLGRKVVSARINLIDSGLLKGKLGSGPVDDEGVPSQAKTVIREGVLKTYLYNTYTGRKGGVVSTGNASRGGFSSLPSVGVSNLFLEPVSGAYVVPKDRLFDAIDKGLYVTDAMGVHTANPISGDFSVGVTGLWIEKGKVAFPVKEAVLSGNILEFFDKTEAVCDDLRFYGNIGAPSLIIPGVDISA
jgi:PmbA protein